jgi:hypothetical protein
MIRCQAFHEINPRIPNKHERNNFTKFISDIKGGYQRSTVASAVHRRHPPLSLCVVSLTDDVRDRRWKSTATTTPILNLAVYQQYYSH